METVKINKSALIRKYLGEDKYKEMGPSELAKTIMSENPSVQVANSEISNIKAKLNGNVKKPSGGTLVDNLVVFKNAVDAVGGKEAASQLLKMLS